MEEKTSINKITECIEAVEAMLCGEKPRNIPVPLQEILVRMYADFFIPETPLSYYTADNETLTPTLALEKGDTRIHPASFELYNCYDHIARYAHKKGYFNWKILGLSDRDINTDPINLAADANALILTRSDLHGLRQGLHLFRAKLDGNPRVANTQLVIQSTQDNFWGPVLDYLNIDNTLKNKGIHVTSYPGDAVNDSALSTLSVLGQYVDNIEKPAIPDRAAIQFSDDTQLKIASTATHKPKEIGQIFESFDVPINIASLFSLMDKPVLAKETAKTCVGNNDQKRKALREKMHEIGREALYAHLRRQGTDPEKAVVIFDDRGLSFVDKRITDAAAFDDVRHHMNNYQGKENPGAELSNLMNHLSWAELQQRVREAYKQVLEQTGEKPNLEIRDTACYIAVKLADMWQENPPMISSFGVTRSIIDLQPKLAPDGTPESITLSDQILRPLAFGSEKTKGEICDYITRHSEMMLATRTVARLAGVKNLEVIREPVLARKFNASETRVLMRIATFYSLIKGSNGHGISHLSRRLPHKTTLLTGNGGKYDPTQIHPPVNINPETERCGDTHENLVNQSLARIRRLIVEADAIFYGPVDADILARTGMKWLKELFFSGPYVGTQVSDPHSSPVFKGFYLPDFGGTYPQTAGTRLDNAKHDATWGANWRDLLHRMKTPLSKNPVDSIFGIVTGSVTEFSRALVRHSQTYIRPTPEDKRFVENGEKAAADLFRVTFYSSASLAKTTPVWSDVKNLTYDVARSGFAVISGGGEEGLMNATAEGVHEYRDIHQGQPQPRHHISSIQCQDTYQMEGLDRRADYTCICNTREERMAKLMNCDAEVLLPGGEGSKEEKAASFLMRALHLTPTRNRAFIIVNQPINGIRPFDELIADITPEECKALNIHIVNDTSEVLPLLISERAALQARLGKDAIYNPVWQPAANTVRISNDRPRAAIA